MDNWQRTDWTNVDRMRIKCPVCCKFNYLVKQGDKFVNRCDVCHTLVEFSATAQLRNRDV